MRDNQARLLRDNQAKRRMVGRFLLFGLVYLILSLTCTLFCKFSSAICMIDYSVHTQRHNHKCVHKKFMIFFSLDC